MLLRNAHMHNNTAHQHNSIAHMYNSIARNAQLLNDIAHKHNSIAFIYKHVVHIHAQSIAQHSWTLSKNRQFKLILTIQEHILLNTVSVPLLRKLLRYIYLQLQLITTFYYWCGMVL